MYLVDCDVRAGCENKSREKPIPPSVIGWTNEPEERYEICSPEQKMQPNTMKKRVIFWGGPTNFIFRYLPPLRVFFSLEMEKHARDRGNNHPLSSTHSSRSFVLLEVLNEKFHKLRCIRHKVLWWMAEHGLEYAI